MGRLAALARLSLPQIVSVALALSIVAELVSVVFRMRLGQPAPSGAMQTVSAQREARSFDVQTIVRAHLFGMAAKPTAVLAEEAETTLSLEGTIATDDPARGFAIINDGTHSKVYQAGGSIAGASLHEVYIDRVVLSRNGDLTVLRLLKHGNPGVALASVGAALPEPEQSYFTDNLGRHIDHEPSKLGRILRSVDVRDDKSGELKGFRVYPIAGGGSLTAMGLVPGDAILDINGVPLNSAEKGRALLDGLDPAAGDIVTIERQGRRMQFALTPPPAADELPN